MKKIFLGVILTLVMLIALTSAALLIYYGQIQQNINVEQAITIAGGDCSNNVCGEVITGVYAPDFRVSDVYTLTNHDPENSRDVMLVTTTDPITDSGEIVTTYLAEVDYSYSQVWTANGDV